MPAHSRKPATTVLGLEADDLGRRRSSQLGRLELVPKQLGACGLFGGKLGSRRGRAVDQSLGSALVCPLGGRLVVPPTSHQLAQLRCHRKKPRSGRQPTDIFGHRGPKVAGVNLEVKKRAIPRPSPPPRARRPRRFPPVPELRAAHHPPRGTAEPLSGPAPVRRVLCAAQSRRGLHRPQGSGSPDESEARRLRPESPLPPGQLAVRFDPNSGVGGDLLHQPAARRGPRRANAHGDLGPRLGQRERVVERGLAASDDDNPPR